MTPDENATSRDGTSRDASSRATASRGKSGGVPTGRNATDRVESESAPTADDEGRTDGNDRAAASARAGEDGTSGENPPNGDGQLSLPLDTLAVLNWLGDSGVDGVENRLNDVLDDDLMVATEQVKVGYAEQRTVAAQFEGDERVGARVLLREPIVGNVLVAFPMDSANKAAALMLQRAVDDLSSVSTEMGRDALTELCNMMANGFIDEWATLFETTIDTGSPVAVQASERTLVRRILKHYEMGLYITSRLRIPEYDLEGTVYVLPGKAEFVTRMSAVGVEVIDG